MTASKDKLLAVADVETTLLAHGEFPRTLFWGLAVEGESYRRFENTRDLTEYLRLRADPLVIYNHHDFDVVQLAIDDAPVRIREVRNGRILRAMTYHHEWRNSYAVFPTSLEKILLACGEIRGQKAGLDDLERRNVQDTDGALRAFKLLSRRFESVFGIPALGEDSLTAAGLAFASAERIAGPLPIHLHDREAYRGGRVEAFRVGACGSASLLDINSSYPYAICDAPERDTLHILDVEVDTDGPCPFFLLTENRDKLLFPRGRFRTAVWASNYERYIQPHPGVKRMQSIRLVQCDFTWLARIRPLIEHAYRYRAWAKAHGDGATEYTAKIGLNSIYGRFGMRDEREVAIYDDKVASEGKDGRVTYFKTPSGFLSFKTVYCQPKANYLFASFVTDNARARLYDALRRVRNPYYCDTDSIYAGEEIPRLPCGAELGAWKFEGRKQLRVVSSKDYIWGECESGCDHGRRFQATCAVKRKGGSENYVWTIKRALAKSPVARVAKNRLTAYDKREVLPDGSTLPLFLEEW